MDMDSTLVIKVKYGDTLRRFNARVNGRGQLDLDMAGLRSKIFGLFNFPQDAELVLTYLDEDGDVVTLAEDDDLLDVMKQNLKFLRVDAHLKNDKFGRSYCNSTGSSTPLRSPRVSSPIPAISSAVLNSVPEPLRQTLLKLSSELTSNPVIGELVDCVSKMSQSLSIPTQQNVTSSSQAAADSPATSAEGTGPSVNTNQTTTTPTVTSNQEAENVNRGVGVPVPSADLNADRARYISGKLNAYSLKEDGAGQMKEKGCSSGYNKKETKGDKAGQQKEKSIRTGATKFSRLPGSQIPIYSHMPPPRTVPNPPPTVPNPLVFHRGVQCDGCGAHPICGVRYKSKVREDYDLCSICFAETGNDSDYMKIDRPLSYRLSRWFKGMHDPHSWGRLYQPPPPLPQMKSARAKLDSRFIMDVNVSDGTVMAPCTSFTKIWRMRNSGSAVWPQGSRLEFIGGDRFSKSDFTDLEIPVDGVPVNGELDVAVDFISPALTGRYISYWSMSSPSGMKFGQRVWVLVQVDASMKDPVCDVLQELNLNLPPDCGGPKHQNVDSGVADSSNTATISAPVSSSPSYPTTAATSIAASGLVNARAEGDRGYHLPEEYISMLNGPLTSSDAPQVFPSPVSYPIIDLSEPAPAAMEPASADVDVLISSKQGDNVKKAVESCSNSDANVMEAVEKQADLNEAMEISLLKELEDMGFKQVDLNKEILRMNEYNLEQSVDALCGVSEWDPILEELEEMGFCDKEMNKKLLKKNNGSIKRVVMDLLTVEKN